MWQITVAIASEYVYSTYVCHQSMHMPVEYLVPIDGTVWGHWGGMRSMALEGSMSLVVGFEN